MTTSNKDTIYVDIDDEITSIIEKMRASDQKIVALVLPKRAAVLQSIVNMKLLKRAAGEAKKNLVLITSESGLLPLAGAVGIHVAKTLQTKPAIPPPPPTQDTPVNVSADEVEALDTSKPVGELAGLPPEDTDETIEVDNDEIENMGTAASTAGKPPRSKKFKIPNFDKFRVRLILAVLAVIALIVGWYFAFTVLPKATVTIKTDTSSFSSNLTITASPKATELDKEKKVVPASIKELKKSESQKVAATGQKNLGQKATGTMNVTNCIDDGESHTLPAGTSFSSGQLTFVTTEAVTLDPALFSGSTCKSADFGLDKDVAVAAAQPGDQYNLNARSYTSSITGIKAFGSAMSGGTSNIVKVVSQQDVDTIKQKIIDQNAQSAKDELTNQLKSENFLPLADTFKLGAPLVTTTPNVGDQADQVTVNVSLSYTMLGAQKNAVKQLIEEDAKKHIDTSKQVVVKDGLDEAAIRLLDAQPNGDVRFDIRTDVTAGPQLDGESIKREIAGKKRGQAQTIIQSRPGIKDVTIEYKPFWVFSTPKKTSHITVIFDQ